ncbi:MAG: NADPH:quinone reductase [Nocardioides sp.]
MRAIIYTRTGDPDVLHLVERPIPQVAGHEVLVRLHVAGVNPTDWKFRRGAGPDQPAPYPEVTPGQDGAGVIDAVGASVSGLAVGDRVWVWLAGWQRPGGTAQEYLAIDAAQVVRLPEHASFDLGANLGVPALTAHRCLTTAENGPERLAPHALQGRTVLVAGGAGAVGNAAIQLATWAGATVITTISGPEKAALAEAAGARHIINYRTENTAERIRAIAPAGVDVVVEVAPSTNADLNTAVVGQGAAIAVYANEGTKSLVVQVRPHMMLNTRYQFVMLYQLTPAAKANAVASVSAAVAAGALRAGPEAGVPFTRFPLTETAAAHAAVEAGAVGKVILDLL